MGWGWLVWLFLGVEWLSVWVVGICVVCCVFLGVCELWFGLRFVVYCCGVWVRCGLVVF